jgi:protocadherin-16/23
MDRDNTEIGDLIKITIKATDNGVPSLSVGKQINLKLIDLNDNAPLVRNKNQLENIGLFESQQTLQPFVQVDALDADQGLNAVIIYEIQNEQTQQVNGQIKKTNYIGVDKNGNLYLQANVDYEKERTIDLALILFGSTKSVQGSVQTKQIVHINILNVNDNPPKFMSLPMSDNQCHLQIEEGSWTTGAFFHKFEATDADDPNGTFFFDLLELSTINKSAENVNQANRLLDTSLFKIGKTNGKLSLSDRYELDREKIDNYKLVLSLKDQEMNSIQLETKLECYIQITDINDNAPVFMSEQIDKNNTELKVFPLMNEISVINWYAATDLDLGINSTIEYSLEILNHNHDEEDEFNNLFNIDSKGYLLLNAQSLTRTNSLDLNDVYMLAITASDTGVPKRLYSKLRIDIKIDENYFSLSQISVDKLELDGSNIITLNENPDVNKFVGKVNAINSFAQQQQQQQQMNNKTNQRYVDLKFRLLTANETFQINEKTGVITVLNSSLIDYELNKDFLLIIEAIESVSISNNNRTRYGTFNMLVKIMNLNDNPPQFNRVEYEFNCEENIFKIPVELFVGANNQFIQITDLDLNNLEQLLPINQLKPVLARITGHDANMFRLVQLSNQESIYKLEALNSFDYEAQNKYDLEISLWDGSFKVSAPLRVNIIDVNDFAPKFEKSKYEFRIDENSPKNMFIGRVNALDQDGSVKMNTINYKILNVRIEQGPLQLNSKEWQLAMLNSNDDLFYLNKQTGELSVGNSRNYRLLDRELITFFDLTVVAYNPFNETTTDKSETLGQMTDTCHIIVYLNDLNDNIPLFDQELYFVNLREKSFSPRAIFKSNAIDLDAGPNGTIKYSIESVNARSYQSNQMNNEFYIDQNDCTLYLNIYVDIDSDKTSKSFDIVIVASDLGKNSLKSKATVLINLIDVNDNKPKIIEPENDQIFSIDENNNNNSMIFQVKAIDPDYSHNKIVYQLDQDLNQDWQYFSINNQTGELRSLISFDYETKRNFSLRLYCTDQNGIMIDLSPSIETAMNLTVLNDSVNAYPLDLKSFVDVKIKINDLDDNEPEFEENVRFENISEILDVGSTILYVKAHDRDSLTKNTMIRYLILSGNEEKMFDLNEKTGELKLIDELERSLQNVYELKLRATSKPGLSANDFSTETELKSKSHLKMVLNIVKDKLFIKFERDFYYISVQYPSRSAMDASSSPNLKQFSLKNLNDDLNTPIISNQTTSIENLKKLQSSACFFSRAHLQQRKLKRKIRFSIDMLQLVRYNENIPIKLPNELVNSFSSNIKQIGRTILNNANRLSSLLENRTSLFDIDSLSGKVYINRDLISKSDYQIGDKFILSLTATAYAANSTSVLNAYESTVTHLTVRLTERDYSIIMRIRNSLNFILVNYLNPLKENYIPLLLAADGMKLSIQDLAPSKLVDPTIISIPNNISEESGEKLNLFDLTYQMETSSDHTQINLDSFINKVKSLSTANIFVKDFDQLTDRQPVQDEPLLSDVVDKNSNLLYDSSRPFYANWFFWVCAIVGLMIFMIVSFFVNCAYLAKHQKENR